MVLSTLRTNSAEGAFTRLVDLGVPEFIVRDVLRGVLAQDLTLRVCPTCGGSGCVRSAGTGTSARKFSVKFASLC
jgi:general secretion pathway protein E